MFRTIGPPEQILEAIQPLRNLVDIEEVLRVPHMKLKTWEDLPMERAVFPFTTDVPLLGAWGTPLLFGPGSFLMAHTAEEHLDLAEFEGAIDKYIHLVSACLQERVEIGQIP